MANKSIIIVVCLSLILPLCFNNRSILLAQDSQRSSEVAIEMLPFVPASDPSNPAPDSLEYKIQYLAKSYKNILVGLYAAKAAREDDINYCNDCGDVEKCRVNFESIILMRYISEGKCNQIKEATFSNVCSALKNDQCSSLSGFETDICLGLLRDNFDQFSLGVQKYATANNKKIFPGFVPRAYSYYRGFKTYNIVACDIFKQGDKHFLTDKYICKVLFGSDADEIIQQFALDMVNFNFAKTENNQRLCSKIKDVFIKKACESKEYGKEDLNNFLFMK
jgi:hypothetical protein